MTLARRKEVGRDGEDIGVLEHLWLVAGGGGAVQFRAREYLPGYPFADLLARTANQDRMADGTGHIWEAWDLGSHCPAARDLAYCPAAGDATEKDACPVIGGPCFYAGSKLGGDAMLSIVWRGGQISEDTLWAELEDYCSSVFIERRYGRWRR